ncbi:hypothetical protein [Chryseobacterium paludis]|uniref:hypothetical protein n=1 Tax=Chryseobacterium paludis TaxID=2956784 RepID=UPI0021C21480|nr:hypothetical protein [Chryseobacterium paludis]
MAKKGVYKITGNSKPKTGDKTLYKVTEWYPDTPSSDRKESMIVWELFRKNKDGRFITTGIKKRGIGEFTFGRKSHQFTFKVEGYLHRPEGKEPMAIIVQPQLSNEKLSKEKAITGVKITYQDGSRVTKPLSYRDRLRAIAHCKNLEGQFINLGLWENYEKGNGHSKKNKLIIKSPPILVDTKGYARWNFNLIPTFVTLSLKREDNKKYQEYYVTAEYNGKIQASDNVNTNNPQYKVPPLSVKKPQPKPETPKGSTNPNSTNNKPDQKGNIHNIKLVDKNGKAFSRKPNFGETIKLIIEGKDVIGKKYTLKLWEHDNTGDNDLVYNNTHIFNADKQEVLITLTDEMRKIGEVGKDPKNPESCEYWTGRWQEIFAEVIFHSISTKSQIIDVGLLEEPKLLDTGNSPIIVQNQQSLEKNKDGECPRCKKLTEKELKAVFPYALNQKLITEIVSSFNLYCDKFNINTCTLKAHFFAQAKQESTDSLSPAIDGESMNYSISGLLNTGLKNVSSRYLFGNKNGIEMARDLGRKENEGSLSIERQIKIANFIYGLNPKAKDLGNVAPEDNKNLSEVFNEGWRYRGRGMLQITGKNNYINVEKHVNFVLGKNILSIKSGRKYNSKFTPTEALLSGLGDWHFHKMYIPAKKGLTKDVCLEVIKIINSATKSKTKRIAYLLGGKWYIDDDTSKKSYTIKEEDSMKFIFRVDECISRKKLNSKHQGTSKVIIKFGSNADESVISEKSLRILQEVGEKTKNFIITITSTARDPYSQARVMYENIAKTGIKEQRKIYKVPGQKVLDIYEISKNKNKQETIKEMEVKIRELGATTVSKHCEDPEIMNVFDVAQTMSNPKDFKYEITLKAYKVLDENRCYHIEIKQ